MNCFTYSSFDSIMRTVLSDLIIVGIVNNVLQGKVTGNKHALWLRWQLQERLFAIGCFIQLHAGKVIFLGLLLLSLCCVGLKAASLETKVENLWVEGTYALEAASVEVSAQFLQQLYRYDVSRAGVEYSLAF